MLLRTRVGRDLQLLISDDLPQMQATLTPLLNYLAKPPLEMCPWMDIISSFLAQWTRFFESDTCVPNNEMRKVAIPTEAKYQLGWRKPRADIQRIGHTVRMPSLQQS